MTGVEALRAKVETYTNSPEGKERLQKTLDNYIASGTKKTKSGQKLTTPADVNVLSKQLIGALRSAAAQLPPSIQAHFNSLQASVPVVAGDHYEVKLYFTDDLSRPSLYEDKWTGIDNIVALYNNGMDAKGVVYGWWEGHAPSGDESKFRSGLVEDSAFIRSNPHRDALHFMNNGVNMFNATYGALKNAVATLGADYE